MYKGQFKSVLSQLEFIFQTNLTKRCLTQVMNSNNCSKVILLIFHLVDGLHFGNINKWKSEFNLLFQGSQHLTLKHR